MADESIDFPSDPGKPVLIYGLIDPRNSELRYIGKTIKSLAARLCCHCASAKSAKHKRPVQAWLCSLGQRPIVELLEQVDSDGDWIEAERFWIAYWRSLGARLTNLSPGGDRWCGRKMSPEEKARRVWLSGKDHPRFGVKESPEILAAKSTRAKALWADVEWAEKHRKRLAAGVRTPENRALCRALAKRMLADPAFKASRDAKHAAAMRRSEVRRKTGAASKRNWSIHRDRIIQAQNAGKGTAWSEKQSADKKRLWASHEYRSHMSAAHMRKLCERDVIKIRRRVETGESQASVARSYGINPSHVSRIVRRENMKHIA